MDAEIGDRLLLAGRWKGGYDRICRLLEIRGASAGPMYRVRWYDTGDEELWSPGSTASLMNLGQSKV